MQKKKFYFFNTLRNFCDFCKLVVVLMIALLIIYWIEVLTNLHFNWLDFIRNFFVNTINLCSSIIEYFSKTSSLNANLKFITSIIIMMIVAISFNYVKILLNYLEDLYNDLHRFVLKKEENFLNKQLQTKQRQEQNNIQYYRITLKTRLKQKYLNTMYQVNIQEENNNVLKFLKEKLNILPNRFEDGFIFDFHNFNKIDNILSIFDDLNNNFNKLDIAVTVSLESDNQCLSRLFNLDFYGKIITTSNVIYRYTFNQNCKFTNTQLGIYQFYDNSVELAELKKI